MTIFCVALARSVSQTIHNGGRGGDSAEVRPQPLSSQPAFRPEADASISTTPTPAAGYDDAAAVAWMNDKRKSVPPVQPAPPYSGGQQIVGPDGHIRSEFVVADGRSTQPETGIGNAPPAWANYTQVKPASDSDHYSTRQVQALTD